MLFTHRYGSMRPFAPQHTNQPRRRHETAHMDQPMLLSTPAQTVAGMYGDEAAAHGFVALPTILLRNAVRLGLSPRDVLLIALILSERYRQKCIPTIRQGDLAAMLGCTVRTVQRDLERLRGLGYLTVVGQVDHLGRRENMYDAQPLIDTAVEVERSSQGTAGVSDENESFLEGANDALDEAVIVVEAYARGVVTLPTPVSQQTKTRKEKLCSDLTPQPPMGMRYEQRKRNDNDGDGERTRRRYENAARSPPPVPLLPWWTSMNWKEAVRLEQVGVGTMR